MFESITTNRRFTLSKRDSKSDKDQRTIKKSTLQATNIKENVHYFYLVKVPSKSFGIKK